MLGLNIEVSFIRNSYAGDDEVGGAVITGTVVYSGIAARLSARRPSQVSLDSGLEVDRSFDMIINGQGLTLYERDEVQVTSPLTSPYYGEQFRIMGIQYDSRRPGRGHTEFTLSQIERSRGLQ
jgi:hypothetical protein